MRQRLLFIFGIWVLGAGLAVAATSDLYLKAFGKVPENKEVKLETNLVINASSVGQVWIKDGTVIPNLQISSKGLVEASDKLLLPKYKIMIRMLTKGRNYVHKDKLLEKGISVNYDQIDNTLTVLYPPEMLNVVKISLKEKDPILGTPLSPGRWMAYTNIWGGHYLYDDPDENEQSIELQGAVGYNRFSLNYNATLDVEGDEDYSLPGIDNLFMSYDTKEHLYRYQAGKISEFPLTALGYSDETEYMMGVSMQSIDVDYEQFYTDKKVSRQVDVEYPGKVSIYRNGSRIFVMNLVPGRYLFEDFPLSAGRNEIVVLLDQEEIDYFTFYSNNYILAPDKHYMEYQLGVPIIGEEFVVPTANLVYTFSHRYGLNDSAEISAGLHRRSTYGMYNLGYRSSWLDHDMNLNYYNAIGLKEGMGWAVVLTPATQSLANYSTSISYENGDVEIGEISSSGEVGVYTLSRGMTWDWVGLTTILKGSYGFREDGSDTAYRLQMGVATDTRKTSIHQFIGSWMRSFDDEDPYSLTLSYRYSLSTGVWGTSLYVVTDPITDIQSMEDVPISVQIGVSWKDEPYKLSYLHEELVKETRFQGNWVEAGLMLDGEYEDDTEQNQRTATMRGIYSDKYSVLDTELMYINEELYLYGAEYESELGPVIRYNEVDINGDGHKRVLSYNGGIAWVDGHWGVAPVVQNNFVIVEKHPSMGDGIVALSGGRRVSGANRVLSSYSPNLESRLWIDGLENAPYGYDMGEWQYSLKPHKNTGYVLTVGSANNVAMVLKLQSEEETKIPKQSVTLFSEELGYSELSLIDQASRVYFSKLTPGKTYTLHFSKPGFSPLELSIPNDAQTGLLQLGPLTVKESKDGEENVLSKDGSMLGVASALIALRGLEDRPMLSGETVVLSHQSQPKFPPITVTLDRRSRAYFSKLIPGQYTLRFKSNKYLPIRVEIPENRMGLINLGVVQAEEKE